MDNITNTYCNQKQFKSKHPNAQQYTTHSQGQREQSAKLSQAKYSSQVVPDTNKKYSNMQTTSQVPMHSQKITNYREGGQTNYPGQKSHQSTRERLVDVENANPIPLSMYSHASNNAKIQSELKKNMSCKAPSTEPQTNNSCNPIALSQSPKINSGRQTALMHPNYEMLISNQALDLFNNQFENNRNSQPPLQYNSHNPSYDKKGSTILAEKKKHQLNSKQKQANDNSSTHKKSQSLFNKKIVDILAGLQQSLGTIASNVKNSFNNDEINQLVLNNLVQGKNKTLIESALLAQKLAQMTSQINTQPHSSSATRQSVDEAKKLKKSSAGKQKGASYNVSIGSQNGFKTIEDSSDPLHINLSVSNRPSMESGVRQSFNKNQIKQVHSRTKSDLQHCRKQLSSNNSNVRTVDVPYQHLSSKVNSMMLSSQNSGDNNGQGQGGITKLTNSQLLRSIDDHLTSSKDNRGYQHLQNNIQAIWQQHPISTKHKKSKQEKNNSCNTNNESNRFKKKSVNTTKANGSLTNQRGSISSKQVKLSCERLSEANAIGKFNKKQHNLLMSNLSGHHYPMESKLKSAASSPSLHANHIITINASQKQSLNIKKKDTSGTSLQKQVFDFSQGQKNLIIKATKLKKQVETNQSINQNHQQSQLSSHKRSISDGNSLTKMFHFKQQMMLNKLLSKGNSAQVSSSNSIQDQNPLHQLGKVVDRQQVQQISSMPLQITSKGPIQSNLSSKRPSNETQIVNLQLSEANYNSPRQQIVQTQNSRLSSSSQRDIYSEMKNFLHRFQVKNQSQIPHDQNAIATQYSQNQNPLTQSSGIKPNQIQIIQSLCNSANMLKDQIGSNNQNSLYGNTRSTAFTSGSNTTLSNGSTINASKLNKQHHQMKSSNQFVIQQSSIPPQNDPNNKSQTSNHHKRAKSDLFSQQLDFMKGSSKQSEDSKSRKPSKENKQPNDPKQPQKIVQSYAPQKQKMFVLNMNQQNQRESMNFGEQPKLQVLSQGPMIQSARASPSSKQIYCNFENFRDNKQNSHQVATTNRSDKQSTSKFANQNKLVFTSNQTTQKKENLVRECSPSEFETPQFNYIQADIPSHLPPKVNTLCYIDATPKVEMSANNKQKQEKQMTKNRNLQIKSSNYSSGGDSTESLYLQNHDLLQSQGERKNNIHSSPQLKVLPTPKAVQPGVTNGIPQSSLLILQTNQTLHSLQSLENVKHLSTSGNIAQEQQDKQNYRTQHHTIQMSQERLESVESMQTNNNLSPRSKEKQRIIKLIKVSFKKLKEHPKTTSDFYRIGKMLGKGAFGRVNLAIHKLTDHLVAVKSINKQFLSEDEGSKKKVMQEFLILQKTRHQNIVKLFDSFESTKHIVFVMELCAGGDLLNYVRKRRKLKEDLARYIFIQVVDGLEYCHAKGIVHRDIKLDNLLLDSNGNVKICDFGVSKIIEDKRKEIMTEQCGTPAYIAPEILKDKGYKGFGVDIWSLGVCLYAMLYGTVPFKANNMSELHQLIIKAKYTLKDDKVEVSDSAKGLIKLLLEPDPTKRLNIKQVKEHSWLKELAVEEIEVFSAEEKMTILKDFSYQDMKRYNRNQDREGMKDAEEALAHQQISTEHFFTEHALDSTQNALLKNCTTKSLVLAPFNSTRSHLPLELSPKDEDGEPILPPLDIDERMIFDKRVIKFAARVKDINRQYEMNNNCELDNGVYNKFVRQSTEKGENEELKSEDSLLASVNQENREGKQAPMVSQNSEEDVEAELIKQHNMQGSAEMNQLQSFLQTQQSIPMVEEQQLILDYESVEKVEEFGYPHEFIVSSLEQFDMNDATTCYFLLEKDRMALGYSESTDKLIF